eukprot:14651813-Alexandrium_andersonii.AAC.1
MRDVQGVWHVQVLAVAVHLLLPEEAALVRETAQRHPVRKGASLRDQLRPPHIVLLVARGPLPPSHG